MSARSSKTSQESHSAVETLKSSKSKSSVKDVMSTKQHRSVNGDIVDIQPMVYSFRVPRNPSPGSVMTATLPPYWLYHDHAFGVIWILFHTDKKYIGISPLHWCLRFLLDLKNSEGEYTGDVNVCIQAVQDDLIEQYANLGTVLENRTEITKDEIKDKHEDIEDGNERGGRDKRSKISDKKSLKNNTRMTNKSSFKGNDQATYKEKVRNASDEADMSNRKGSDAGSITDSINDDTAKGGDKVIDKEVTRISSTERFGSSTNFMSFHELPSITELHSITYNEMISRGPMPYTEQTPIEQIFRSDIPSSFASSTPKKAAKSRMSAEETRMSFSDKDTDELVNFLNNSRQQHVERIKKEIERLYGLEKFMENINNQGFSAYITGDLARRLDKLDGQDVVNEIERIME